MVKPPVDLDAGSSTIMPGQQVVTATVQQLPELSELSQWELFTILICHPVEWGEGS